MSAQDNDDMLPLHDLWQRLTKAGLPLGTGDYFRLLEALQAGFGLKDRAALRRLCHALWIRSAEERRLFDYHFDQIMTPVSHLQHSDTSSSPTGEHPVPPPPLSGGKDEQQDMTWAEEAEENALQAIQTPEPVYEIPSVDYDFSDEYFPLTRQQMKQSWRYLRQSIRGRQSTELDVEATVREVGRTGTFLGPAWIARHKHMAQLLLLIDYSNSMVPFQMLSERLIQTLDAENLSDEVGIYYFRNYPTDVFYCDTAEQEYKSFQEVLSEGNARWTGVLIFSDAGAAREDFNSYRIKQTEHFIKEFALRFRHIAWLNPVPNERWFGSTAGVVQRSVPMFDLEHHGLDAAIDILCGRSPYNTYQQEAY